METTQRELEEPSSPGNERTQRKKKKAHTIWSLTPIIGMSDPITSNKDGARARRCFVDQFPVLDVTCAWNIFRDIFAPMFDLLVIETKRYARQNNDTLFTVSSSKFQKFVSLIIPSAMKNRCYFRDYWSKLKTL